MRDNLSFGNAMLTPTPVSLAADRWNLRRLLRKLFELPRYQKTIVVAASDAGIAAWAAWAAIYLRLGQSHWLYGNQAYAVVLPVFLGPPIFLATGLYRRIFRHGSATDMVAVVRACAIFGAIYAAVYTVIGVDRVPRTVGLIQPTLLLLGMMASRSLALYVLRPEVLRSSREGTTNALIYGAGHTGRQLAVALRNDPHVRIVGFLDDDPSLQNRALEGLKVFDPARAEELIAGIGVKRVLLAIPTATRFRRRQIIEALRESGVEIRILPGLAEFAKGEVDISDIREVRIEDLLGREPVMPDPALLRSEVAGRVIMVTGGGGSIGGELSRQLLTLEPSRLIIVEASEYALYAIERDLLARRAKSVGPVVDIVAVLGLVQNEGQMRAIIELYRPDTIYHAAAYKHVPLVEANPLRGIENNSLGTYITASLASEYGTHSFVLISTDKAVRPTNVMGASKRLAELAVQGLATAPTRTRFCSVRFGNVLGSSGSVVPLFREQIEKGGPLTITDPEVTRYFMTIPEAAQLVIQAAALADSGDVFLLDMGDPVRVMDLAVNMIRLSGLTVRSPVNPEGDIEIHTVGLRPGEKLYEELLIDSSALATHHPQIMRAREPFLEFSEMTQHLEQMKALVAANDAASGVRLLRRLVPDYRPASDLAA